MSDMDAVFRIFREACPKNNGKLAVDQLRQALCRVAQDKIDASSIDSLLEDLMNGRKQDEIDVEVFLSWLQKKKRKLEDMSYLAKVIMDMPHVNQVVVTNEPRFPDDTESFRKLHAGDSETLARLVNTVKVCPKCGKPNAFTLLHCNACGADLKDVALSHSDNVFMGFIYGIAKGKFPYTISMRAQTEDFLCFDDPLQCSPCHLNAIPTSVYCPDLRFLFSDPPRGVELLKQLFELAASVAKEQYWSDEAFRQKYFAGCPRPQSLEEFRDCTVMGLNFPPSMYQLHLQFIHMPLLPFHYDLLRKKEHFTRGRFFPLDYLLTALSKGDAVKSSVTQDTDIAVILDKVSRAGVDYTASHDAMISRAHEAQQLCSAWKETDFEYRVMGSQVFDKGGTIVQPGLDPKQVQKSDCLALQNYGRPFAGGKPTGSYYKYAKEPRDVVAFSK